MQLLIDVAAVCAFMFVQDILGSGLTISQARGLRWWPGLFDGFGDYPAKYGSAVVAVTAVHFGLWSWQTFVVTTCCALTSFFTSNYATGKGSEWLPQDRLEQVSVREWFGRLRQKGTSS